MTAYGAGWGAPDGVLERCTADAGIYGHVEERRNDNGTVKLDVLDQRQPGRHIEGVSDYRKYIPCRILLMSTFLVEVVCICSLFLSILKDKTDSLLN